MKTLKIIVTLVVATKIAFLLFVYLPWKEADYKFDMASKEFMAAYNAHDPYRMAEALNKGKIALCMHDNIFRANSYCAVTQAESGRPKP